MNNLTRYFTYIPLMIALAVAAHTEVLMNNIALGRPVEFAAPPDYPYCTDENDAVQLTDGERCPSDSVMWVDKKAVGWAGVSPVVFTIDLGEVQPISGVSYSTGAGFAGVAWPNSVFILVSEDRRMWRVVGDLVRLADSKPPPMGEYHQFTYVTRKLITRGRYVQLAVQSQTGAYVFTDEVEVYKGPDSLLTVEMTGETVADAREYVLASRITDCVRDRLEADIAYVKRALGESDLPADAGKSLNFHLEEIRYKADVVNRMTSPDFLAVLPVNSIHAEVFRVYAQVIRAKGLPQFFAWKKHRYDPLGHFELPAKAPKSVQLSITMMRNEFRSDSFLLTNASDKPVTVPLGIQGISKRQPPWLRLSSIPWTDTSGRIPIAAALPEAPYSARAYQVEIPSGMTRKIWLTVDSSKLKAGEYNLTMLAELPTGAIRIPFKIKISRLAMRKPGLSIGMWDYTDAKTARGIHDGNRLAAIELMRSHFLDSPWATAESLPWPGAKDFDSENRLKSALSFDVMDRWVKLWPGAKYYFVFASVGDTFAGAKVGSPEFHQRVGAWAKAVDEHRRKLGIKPGRLALLLVDEPFNDWQDVIIAAWARAIKEYAPGIGVFTDPLWERPDLTANQDAFLKADIICPSLHTFLHGPKEGRDYYAKLLARGKTLWFYQCGGPTKMLCPDRYYRLQAWYAFKYGMTGTAFWSFGDAGGCADSFNEYTCVGPSYTPVFLTRTGAVDGIHWQAVMEGVEDYEYMAMLRDKADKSNNKAFKDKAEALLAEIAREVTPDRKPTNEWSKDGDRTLTDKYRLKVLSLLESAVL